MKKSSTGSVVRYILRRYPTLYRSMQMGVLNYSAAARFIQSEVESLLTKEVELNTIVASFTRMAKSMEDKVVSPSVSILKKSRLSVTTGMSHIEIGCDGDSREQLLSDISRLHLLDYENVSIHQFPSCLRIICSTSDADILRKKLGKKFSMSAISGLAVLYLKLQMPVDEDTMSIAYIIDLLNRNDINVIATYSVQHDILLLVKGRDVSRAMELLRVESTKLMM